MSPFSFFQKSIRVLTYSHTIDQAVAEVAAVWSTTSIIIISSSFLEGLVTQMFSQRTLMFFSLLFHILWLARISFHFKSIALQRHRIISTITNLYAFPLHLWFLDALLCSLICASLSCSFVQLQPIFKRSLSSITPPVSFIILVPSSPWNYSAQARPNFLIINDSLWW